jgi:thiamine biosynthesis lipoprotein
MSTRFAERTQRGTAAVRPARPAAAAVPGTIANTEIVSTVEPMMGGRVGVHVLPPDGDRLRAGREIERVMGRIEAWASRLTRFTASSELTRLNVDPRPAVPVRPTLSMILDWARAAEGLTDGLVDIALLDARLAAEGLSRAAAAGRGTASASAASRSWALERCPLGGVVRRPAGLRFDLDGVAKGWLADRALGLLDRHPVAVVDADGDIAVRLGPGERFRIGVADPRRSSFDLAVLELAGPQGTGEACYGLATSGTSVHRWIRAGQVAHHLIDPRTGWSARTDIVQATVLAGTAREAEALAKTAVILGSEAALPMLDRPGVEGALLLTERDEILMLPSTARWLA